MQKLTYDLENELTRKSKDAIYAQVLTHPRFLVSEKFEDSYVHRLTLYHSKYPHLEVFLRYKTVNSQLRIEVDLSLLKETGRKMTSMHYTYFSEACSVITMAANKCPLKILEDIEKRISNRSEVEAWALKVKEQTQKHIEYLEREGKFKELMKGIEVGKTSDLMCLEWDERTKWFNVRSYSSRDLTPEEYQKLGLALGDVVRRFNNGIEEFKK
jgi:hypothetical protein